MKTIKSIRQEIESRIEARKAEIDSNNERIAAAEEAVNKAESELSSSASESLEKYQATSEKLKREKELLDYHNVKAEALKSPAISEEDFRKLKADLESQKEKEIEETREKVRALFESLEKIFTPYNENMKEIYTLEKKLRKASGKEMPSPVIAAPDPIKELIPDPYKNHSNWQKDKFSCFVVACRNSARAFRER